MFCVFLIEYYKVDPVVYRNKDDEVMNGVTESGVCKNKDNYIKLQHITYLLEIY